ncbi:hypothetical protein, partial [Parachitinimonas caeni]
IVYGPETVVGVIDMCHFNRDTWSSYRGGAIEVIRACVSRFGIDPLEIRVGNRGRVHTERGVFAPDSRIRSISNPDEQMRVLTLLQEALPVLRFDRYSVEGGGPAICIAVDYEKVDTTPSEEPLLDIAQRQVDRLLQDLPAQPIRSNWDALELLENLAVNAPV